MLKALFLLCCALFSPHVWGLDLRGCSVAVGLNQRMPGADWPHSPAVLGHAHLGCFYYFNNGGMAGNAKAALFPFRGSWVRTRMRDGSKPNVGFLISWRWHEREVGMLCCGAETPALLGFGFRCWLCTRPPPRWLLTAAASHRPRCKKIGGISNANTCRRS